MKAKSVMVVAALLVAAGAALPCRVQGAERRPEQRREHGLGWRDVREMPPGEQPPPRPGWEKRTGRPMHSAPKALRASADLILLRARDLELTKDQISELKERRLNARLEAVELNAAAQQAQLKLEAALDEEEVDLDAVKELIHAAAKAKAELRYLEIELSVKARGLLTDEQQARLEELVREAPWRILAPPEPPRRGRARRRAEPEREGHRGD